MRFLFSRINSRVSAKITLGFSVVLLLHISIVVMNHVGLKKSQQDFRLYDQIQNDAVVIQDIDHDVAELQRNVLLYTYTGHSGPRQRVEQLHEKLLRLIRQSESTAQSQENSEALQTMQEYLNRYMEYFQAVSIDRQRRYELANNVMGALRQEVSEALHQIASLADAQSDAGALTSHADENLLLADAEATRYRQELDATRIKKSQEHLAKAWAITQQLIEEIGNNTQKKMAAKVLDLIKSYESAMLEMVQATRSYLHLVNVVMTGEAVEFAHLTSELKANSDDRVDRLSDRIIESSEKYLWYSHLVSFITIAVGLIAAWAIGRSIVPALRQMTATLSRLARGEHGAEVPSLNRKDEIGQMALAAQVFKEKTIQTQQLLEESERLSTERRRVNLELSQKNAEMERFTYTASHDLKSPLVSCSGLIRYIFEDIEAGNYEEVKKSADRISHNISRMEGCINDLLELSRIGRVRHDLERVNPNDVIADLLIDFKVRIDELDVSIEVQSDMPKVLADRMRFIEVFDNLITNALKYGCPGPGHTVSIGSELAASEIRYFVRDDGAGIAKSFHQKIFGLFQRLENTQEGSGIGLTIVARIMEVHGGRAWVESKEGQGATFWVSFPTQAIASHSTTVRS